MATVTGAVPLIESIQRYENQKANGLVDSDVTSAIAKQFIARSYPLDLMPFVRIDGFEKKYLEEKSLGTVAFRALNETYNYSSATTTPKSEPLKILSGTFVIDNITLNQLGEGDKFFQTNAKAKALAYEFNSSFINGDSSSNPKEIDGLKKRLTPDSTQLIAAGATSGGDALSLLKLDELLDAVDRPMGGEQKVIFLNKTLMRRMTQKNRETYNGFLTMGTDNYGNPVYLYAGVPLLCLEEDADNNAILPFTETNPGGGTPASTSIYCCLFGPEALYGIYGGPIQVYDVPQLQTSNSFQRTMEWTVGMVPYNPRSIARLKGVKDAAISL